MDENFNEQPNEDLSTTEVEAESAAPAPESAPKTAPTPAPQQAKAPNPVPTPPPAAATKAKVDKPKKNINNAIKYFILLIIVLVLTNPGLMIFLPLTWRETMTNAVSNLIGDVTQISHVVSFSWITLFQLIVMVLALLFLHALIQWILSKIKPNTARRSTLLSLAKSLVSYACVLGGIFWGLALIGVNVSTLFASAGILVLIISFGAENLIADVVTGLFMIFENQYQVGDIVEVDNFRGTVTSISIRTTCVTDLGDNTKIFNNSDMRNIINLSNKLSTAVCDISVECSADLNKVRELMGTLLPKIQSENSALFPETPIYLGVQGFEASGVTLRIVAHVKERDRFTAYRLMNEQIKIGLDSAGFTAPYPHVVIAHGE